MQKTVFRNVEEFVKAQQELKPFLAEIRQMLRLFPDPKDCRRPAAPRGVVRERRSVIARASGAPGEAGRAHRTRFHSGSVSIPAPARKRKWQGVKKPDVRSAQAQNYYRPLREFLAQHQFRAGIADIDIRHDDWCAIHRGEYCNCEPEIRLRPPGRIENQAMNLALAKESRPSPERHLNPLTGEFLRCGNCIAA
jgi:hypothetical protein